ncbi:MAG: histidinol-phosphate transaminase [Planctomycetales bacterium]|nr:histidinol-phosphate transaminase [Planctomycetales bacterium]
MTYFRDNIEAMRGYVPGEQPQGGKFIKLNTNENPYPAPDAVRRAIEARVAQGLAKYPDPSATAFRLRAAELLGVEPDWIVCGNGSDDVLTVLTRAFVGEGQRLRTPTPSYIFYRTLAEIQGAACEEIRFNDDWSLSDEFITNTDGLRLAFLPNPNSPSGTCLSPQRVLELAEALPCPLVVDEAYADFAETNCIDLVRRCEKVIVTRSLSKSYALAGLRFGFAVAQPHIAAGLMKVKDPCNCDALAIAAATAAIDDEAWLAETRGKIITSRARLTAAMRTLGFAVVDSQANFVWNVHAELPVRPMFEELRRQRVLVRYMDYAGWGDGLRISVGTDEQLDVCLDLIKKLV